MKPTKLLALAAPALLCASIARADAPVRPTPTAPDALALRTTASSAGLVALARIMAAVASATAATVTTPMCDTAGRPMAGNVGKAMPDHACSLAERLHAVAGA